MTRQLRNGRGDCHRDAQTTETRETGSGQLLAAEELAGRGTILLVEDDAFVRGVTGEVLRAAGYEVLTARNAAEAAGIYATVRRDGVELLVSDVILPGGERPRAGEKAAARESGTQGFAGHRIRGADGTAGGASGRRRGKRGMPGRSRSPQKFCCKE